MLAASIVTAMVALPFALQTAAPPGDACRPARPGPRDPDLL